MLYITNNWTHVRVINESTITQVMRRGDVREIENSFVYTCPLAHAIAFD